MERKKIINKTISLPDGREISIETGKLAKQADGSVVVKMGTCMLLATAVSSQDPVEGADFLPLTVAYQEQFYAAGRFPGGFMKREGRLSNYEILISRIVDRTLRPLFPDDYHADTQVLITLISMDEEVMPDTLAGLAASAALAVSDIPFHGPISEVRVGKIDGKLVINPTPEQIKSSTIDLIVAGSESDLNMVEGEMDEISEEEMVEALKFAHEVIRQQCKVQKELEAEAGKTEKREYSHEDNDAEIKQKVFNLFRDKLHEIATSPSSKDERSEQFSKLIDDHLETLDEEEQEKSGLYKKYFKEVKKEVIRNVILKNKIRLDGRDLDEVRAISIDVDYLPSAHGSAVFTRGETQALAAATLGGKLDEQTIDGVMIKGSQKFYLHYNFPPFSTGETRMLRGPGRREIGHGNLAERAIKKVLPKDENNNYTIRIVSDILESNGSSSMATVCAGCLSLMDAGIPIKAPVSGIAMGLISAEDGSYAILSDILGDEDHLGDMDFKVTGTKNGITACQMDLKVHGLSYEVLTEALDQARRGRLHILDKMMEAMPQSRSELKPHTPRIERLYIDKEFIGAVIGPGGKQIQLIQNETGASISIEEVDNKGVVEILSENKASLDKAKSWIQSLTQKPEVGETYAGIVKSIMPFGAFVEFLPGKDGLLHISEIAWEKTDAVENVLSEGQEVDVKLKEVDKKTGKYSLTRKELLPKPEGYVERPPRDRGDRGGNRGGRDDRRGGDHRGRDDRDRRGSRDGGDRGHSRNDD